MTNEERDNLLIELKTDVSWIKAILQDHMKSHQAIRLLVWGALLSGISALILSLIS